MGGCGPILQTLGHHIWVVVWGLLTSITDTGTPWAGSTTWGLWKAKYNRLLDVLSELLQEARQAQRKSETETERFKSKSFFLGLYYICLDVVIEYMFLSLCH